MAYEFLFAFYSHISITSIEVIDNRITLPHIHIITLFTLILCSFSNQDFVKYSIPNKGKKKKKSLESSKVAQQKEHRPQINVGCNFVPTSSRKTSLITSYVSISVSYIYSPLTTVALIPYSPSSYLNCFTLQPLAKITANFLRERNLCHIFLWYSLKQSAVLGQNLCQYF